MSDTAPVPSPSDASHVLVAAPPIRNRRFDLCRSLLTADGRAANVLVVTYRRPVPRQFEGVATDAGTPQVSVVTVGPEEPDAAVTADFEALPVDVSLTAVPATDSLTELGLTVEERLEAFDEQSRPIRVCFDSLTSLFLYTDAETATEFLSWLQQRMDAVDAEAHYHADPGAHDFPVREQFAEHFDGVVAVDDDGDTVTHF